MSDPRSAIRATCLYGKTAAPFVEPVVADLQRAAAGRGAEIAALPIESAVRTPHHWRDVERLYVLPFDVPLELPADLPPAPALLVRALFPRAEVVNAPAAHELCWDKLAMARQLLERGVPMPTSVITGDPDEARAFIRAHGHAILKEPRSCGGHGHVVVFADDAGTIAGEVPGRRYVVELEPAGVGRTIAHGVLSYPPPFYLQRLVTAVGRAGALRPAQILRAYVVDGQIVFWTERYRDRVRRPGDFIITAAFGAKYRLLPGASEAADKVARRAAEALGVRVGAVDLVRAGDEGPDVLDVDTDGPHMMIDRSFKQLPEFRDPYDFDRYIAELLIAPAPEPVRHRPAKSDERHATRREGERRSERPKRVRSPRR